MTLSGQMPIQNQKRNSCKTSPLWVVTSYFNPSKYRRRYKNFEVFRRFLNAPLLVVELGRGGDFQLTKDDGDIVLQLSGEDRIWQKERLLNIGIEHLPDHVEYVAWVDCDVIFDEPDWVEQAIRDLEDGAHLIQLFQRMLHLPSDWSAPEQRDFRDLASVAVESEVSFLHWLDQEPYSQARFRYDRSDVYFRSDSGVEKPAPIAPGIGWAARRAVLSETFLYDANIIGSGDTAVAFAAAGLASQYETCLVDVNIAGTQSPWLTEAQRLHYQLWAARFDAGVDRKTSYLPQDVFHLWHGDLTHRDYDQRFRHLIAHDFDPDRDVQISESGPWQWSNPDSPMARGVAGYFDARREDG